MRYPTLLIALLLFVFIGVANAQPTDSLSASERILRQSLGELSQKLAQAATAELYLTRGQVKQVLKDTAGALADFTSAIDLAPDSGNGYIARALLRVKQRDYSRANADFSKALLSQSAPYHAWLYQQRGRVRLLLAAHPEAESDFDQMLAADSSLFDGYYYRGIARSEQQKYALALADFNRSIALLPTVDAYIKRGVLFKRQGRYKEAKADFNQAIALSPLYGATYFERANLELATGERVAGYLDMVKARSLGNEAAEKFLSRYEQEAGNDTLRFYNTPEIVVEAQSERYREIIKETIELNNILIECSERGGGTMLPTSFNTPKITISPFFISVSECNKVELKTRRMTGIMSSMSSSLICLGRLIVEEVSRLDSDPELRLRATIVQNLIETSVLTSAVRDLLRESILELQAALDDRAKRYQIKKP